MKSTDTLIYAYGSIYRNISPKNGRQYELKELCDMLGCDIVGLLHLEKQPGYVMVIDEVASPEYGCYNHFATQEYAKSNPMSQSRHIIGNVLICRSDRVEDIMNNNEDYNFYCD